MHGTRGFALYYASSIASEICELLEPFCEKVEVAGSIRRGKPIVKDIEIVAVSSVRSSADMFLSLIHI